jgi:hypothetical protein
MSRSRRKQPKTGITTASSEKRDKQRYNRRFRHASKQAFHIDPEIEVPPHLYDYSDPWAMEKDGKQRFDPALVPHLLRK